MAASGITSISLTSDKPIDGNKVTAWLNNLLQVKENQAVLQVATWMEQVRTDGGKREPVGAWVVAEMPVGRGDYVGRKQFIKLPLWSSETRQYLLRDIPDKVVKSTSRLRAASYRACHRSRAVSLMGK